MNKKNNDVVKPIKITINETGEEFTLEFNRESVKFAEARGFKVDDLASYPMTLIADFFFYAFRMHHKNVSRQRTDAILEDMGGVGGLPSGFVERLYELYSLPFETLNGDDLWVDGKNSKMTVEF